MPRHSGKSQRADVEQDHGPYKLLQADGATRGTDGTAFVPAVMDEHLDGVWDREKESAPSKDSRRSTMLVISFLLMVVVGFLNNIFSKLQSLPMGEFVNFSNLYVTFCYIPLSLAWVIPMARTGQIPKEDLTMPKRPFMVMGCLDAMSGIMLFWALVQLTGPMANLLQQSAIPISMLISSIILKARYSLPQYVGALVVAGGIAIVLYPSLSSSGDSSIIVSATVLILSCVPMTLSSVYKEIALGERDLDPTYFNLCVAVFQLMASLPLTVPTIYAQGLSIRDLLPNLWGGLKCYVGVDTGVPKDPSYSCSFHGPLYMNVYIVINLLYNVLINLILKYGSANILWLALTTRVPLTNLAFSLKFMPGAKPMASNDIWGLVVIMLGLMTYRFGNAVMERYRQHRSRGSKNGRRDSGTEIWGLSSERDVLDDDEEGSVGRRPLLAGGGSDDGSDVREVD